MVTMQLSRHQGRFYFLFIIHIYYLTSRYWDYADAGKIRCGNKIFFGVIISHFANLKPLNLNLPAIDLFHTFFMY